MSSSGRMAPLSPSLPGRRESELQYLPASRHSWPNQYLCRPTLGNFSLPLPYWVPMCPPPYSLILLLKYPVKSVRIDIEFSSCWALFSTAIVYYWLQSVLTILTSVWLCSSLVVIEDEITQSTILKHSVALLIFQIQLCWLHGIWSPAPSPEEHLGIPSHWQMPLLLRPLSLSSFSYASFHITLYLSTFILYSFILSFTHMSNTFINLLITICQGVPLKCHAFTFLKLHY